MRDINIREAVIKKNDFGGKMQREVQSCAKPIEDIQR